MAIETFTLSHPDIGEVEFEIISVESLNMQWGLDDSRITVQYRIPWEDRFIARDLLLGRTTVGNAPSAHLKRTLPHKWLEDVSASGPPENTIYAVRVSNTVGLEKLDQPDCYAYAVITVVYEGLPYDVVPDADIINSTSGVTDESSLKRWVELGDRSTDGRILQSFGLGLIYCNQNDVPDNSRAVRDGAPFPYFEQTLSLVWHQVPRNVVPWTLYSEMTNKMNQSAFGAAELCGVYPPRTLLFAGATPVFTRLPNQTRAINVKLKFRHNPRRWDYLPDPAADFQWRRVVMRHRPNNVQRTLFEEDDFQKLFRPV
jgi:hypothetical protein